MTARDLHTQLAEPDRLGRNLALFRTRLYRFSDDQRDYTLAETLEERYLDGHRPRNATMAYVQACLDAIRHTGRPLPFPSDVATTENIDTDTEIVRRRRYGHHHALDLAPPERIIAVVGAPRSGTSHLVNLLARQQRFAYLTTASCWAWPVRNLYHPARRLLTELTDAEARTALGVDNKRTRVIPGLVMPGEAEDIYARALPVYRHHFGHRYNVTQCKTHNLDILNGAARSHLDFFGTPILLTKSPFNCFRIPQLEQLWGNKIRYIHIIRGQRETAASIRRNRFEYLHSGIVLSAEEAHALFVTAVQENGPPDRLLTTTHQALISQPHQTITRILDWLGLATETADVGRA